MDPKATCMKLKALKLTHKPILINNFLLFKNIFSLRIQCFKFDIHGCLSNTKFTIINYFHYMSIYIDNTFSFSNEKISVFQKEI